MSDTVCSYCGERLPAGVTVTERMRRAVGRAKWRYKLATHKRRGPAERKPAGSGVLSRGVGLAVCAVLIAVGGWFMYSAVKGEGFSDFIIALTLLLYGGGSGYNILKRK